MLYEHPIPGEILQETVFEPINMSVTEAAHKLCMSRAALSRVLNGKAGISPGLALRLEMAGISTAEFWIGGQANYDLRRSERRCKLTGIEPMQTASGTLQEKHL